MALDLGATMLQLDQVAMNLGRNYSDRRGRLLAVVEAARRISPQEAREKTRKETVTNRPFMTAQVVDSLVGSHAPTEPPTDWCAVSVDGSHIDVDRHTPARCFLVNIGISALTYGSRPDANLFSRPRLYATDDELALRDPLAS